MSLPHLSHWSPLASYVNWYKVTLNTQGLHTVSQHVGKLTSYAQNGQVPSTNLSAKNLQRFEIFCGYLYREMLTEVMQQEHLMQTQVCR